MAKNQEARKRKHSSRNGSSGRGNGVDTAKLNGKAKPKTIDETPGWQKTAGALVLITGVLAAAFMTGVIRIDRNIDNDGEQNHTQEAHSTVADIKDSKSNKTTVLFTQTEPSINLTSQETPTDSELKAEHHRDQDKKSESDVEVDNKKAVNSESTANVPPQRLPGSDADVTEEVNDIEEKGDQLDFQEKTVLKEKRNVLKERADGETEPVPAHGNRKTEDTAKAFAGKEATVTETDSPKGKMVTPKRTPRSTENTKESQSKPLGKDNEGSSRDADVGRPPRPQETRQVEEAAPDGLESKSGVEQDVSSPKKDGGTAERKTGKADGVRPPQEMIQPEKERTMGKDRQTKNGEKANKSPRKDGGVRPPPPVEKNRKSAERTRKSDDVNPPPPVEDRENIKKSPRKAGGVSPPPPQEDRKKFKNSPRKDDGVRPPPPEEKNRKSDKHSRKSDDVNPPPPVEDREKVKKSPRKAGGVSPPPPQEDREKVRESQGKTEGVGSSPQHDTIQRNEERSLGNPPPAQEMAQPEAERTINKDEQSVDRSDASKVRENISRKTESKKPIQKSVLETLLEEAEGLIQKNKKDQALNKYEDIIKRFPNSAKALMAKAQLLDTLAEERRSNDLLDGAIQSYRLAADAPNCPRDIKKAALARMGDRLAFFGKSSRSIQVYLELVKEFPDDYESKKSLAVQYLIAGKNKRAKHYFEEMVESNPMDGFALVHLGFILKSEENYIEAIPLLRAGIDTGDREANEGKFFFHLGESFLRTGQIEESYKVYDEAVGRGHFRSRYQRSLYNVDSLRGKPFWTAKEAGFADAAKKLESNWETIRDEAVALLGSDGFFKNEEEKLRETGDWKQFTLFAKGSKDQVNCRQAPRTCEIFDSIPQSRKCKRGQVKFSVMHPGTHVWPHCGPTNCRLRSHLGLVVPQPVRLRVGNTTRTWEEGKHFIFDDSFEHEVWQEADSPRLILIADLWHPDLSESEKRKLTPI